MWKEDSSDRSTEAAPASGSAGFPPESPDPEWQEVPRSRARVPSHRSRSKSAKAHLGKFRLPFDAERLGQSLPLIVLGGAFIGLSVLSLHSGMSLAGDGRFPMWHLFLIFGAVAGGGAVTLVVTDEPLMSSPVASSSAETVVVSRQAWDSIQRQLRANGATVPPLAPTASPRIRTPAVVFPTPVASPAALPAPPTMRGTPAGVGVGTGPSPEPAIRGFAPPARPDARAPPPRTPEPFSVHGNPPSTLEPIPTRAPPPGEVSSPATLSSGAPPSAAPRPPPAAPGSLPPKAVDPLTQALADLVTEIRAKAEADNRPPASYSDAGPSRVPLPHCASCGTELAQSLALRACPTCRRPMCGTCHGSSLRVGNRGMCPTCSWGSSSVSA